MSGIYIVGMPRSGTTLVQSLISTSDDVISFPETHIFNATNGLFRGNPRILGIIKSNLAANYNLWRLGFRKFFWANNGLKAVVCLDKLLRRYAGQRGFRHYLEKTPSHLYASRTIESSGIDYKIIFVVREVGRNVDSYLKVAPSWSKGLDQSDAPAAIARWYQDTVLCILRAKKMGGLIVNYDRLISLETRNREMSRIEEYLGIKINDSPSMLSKAAKEIVSDCEPWKSNNKLGGIMDIDREPLPVELLNDIELVNSELVEISRTQDLK